MRVFIPSAGRANRALTPTRMPAALAAVAEMIVPPEEAAAYRAAGYANVVPCAAQAHGIGAVRQWLMERSDGKMLMLDDDLRFDCRREDEKDKFLVADDAAVFGLFEEIERHLDIYLHVGVTTREGGNRIETMEPREVGRMLRMLAYDAPKVLALGVRFDRLPLMEDMDVTLQLLKLGKPNLIINRMVHGQGGSGAAGGMSRYRTPELQAETARRLSELHYPHVSVRTKFTKGAWGGGEREDVVVAWKEAYAEGCARLKQHDLF